MTINDINDEESDDSSDSCNSGDSQIELNKDSLLPKLDYVNFHKKLLNG